MSTTTSWTLVTNQMLSKMGYNPEWLRRGATIYFSQVSFFLDIALHDRIWSYHRLLSVPASLKMTKRMDVGQPVSGRSLISQNSQQHPAVQAKDLSRPSPRPPAMPGRPSTHFPILPTIQVRFYWNQ